MRISVTVIPRSSQKKIVAQQDGTFRVYLPAAPVDGAANAVLVEMLAKHFHVSKSRVTIERGEMGRRKIIDINTN